MNAANLQFEGLLMAIASINLVLVRKGVLSPQEIDVALRKAEASVAVTERPDDISPSNRNAFCFPIRLLQLANQCQPEADIPSYSELAQMVGQMEEPRDNGV
ncbi:hypothetical protein [Pseudaminobacter soli (ex Li et al. 2025)]|uniref:Uncharacterized protein n=1 Tax=Pseudaminobacter soli (ex Li et al. 2025) TaxID=1295366 RepID=A0A2P7S012_9HYPH|nr:hypothetical protein [Mesorhizobium soli]PSJ55772.1 hypothetical protein C7I85_26135 [Mesorhizobium soli]